MGQVLFTILGGLVLAGAGAAIGYWFGAGGRQRSKAEALQKEFDDYRERVGSHFAQSAQHFQTIGREYRALYDHMASGAEALCDTPASEERLSFDPNPVPVPSAGAESAEGNSASGEEEAEKEAASDVAEDADEKGSEAASESGPAAQEAAADDGQEAGPDSDASKTDDSTPDTPDTPDTRARDAGGESAPAEDDDESATNDPDKSAAATNGAGADSGIDKPAAEAEETVPVDKEATGDERIYH